MGFYDSVSYIICIRAVSISVSYKKFGLLQGIAQVLLTSVFLSFLFKILQKIQNPKTGSKTRPTASARIVMKKKPNRA